MLHVIALAATPAAFAWSAFWALVFSRLITAACRLAAAAPLLAAYCARSGLTGYAAIRARRRWRSTPPGRRRAQAVLSSLAVAASAAFAAYLLAALTVYAIGFPLQISYTARGLTFAAAPEVIHERWVELRVAAVALVLFVVFTLRAALGAAYRVTVGPRGQDARLPPWLNELVPAENRRMLAADEALQDRMALASFASSCTVTYVVCNRCLEQIGMLVGPATRAVVIGEMVLLAVMGVLVCRRLAGTLASTTTVFMIVSCLGDAEQSPAEHDRDPLGALRTSLDRLAARLRAHARHAERKAALRTAVQPYPVVLRGVARSLDQFTAGRASLSGRLAPHTTTMLRRSAGVLGGAASHDTLRRLAKSVRAYRADGTPDPQLVVRVPRWFMRWGAALPARIEGTRRLLGAVAWLGVTVLALALLVRGRLGVDSLPTWVKP